MISCYFQQKLQIQQEGGGLSVVAIGTWVFVMWVVWHCFAATVRLTWPGDISSGRVLARFVVSFRHHGRNCGRALHCCSLEDVACGCSDVPLVGALSFPSPFLSRFPFPSVCFAAFLCPPPPATPAPSPHCPPSRRLDARLWRSRSLGKQAACEWIAC